MTKISEAPTESETVEYVKSFSKRMLKTHLFIGSFHEKRFVQSLGAYRDVVRINSNEKQFIDNLLIVKNKIKKLSAFDSTWTGITEPDTIGAPVGHNLWVELPIEVFGRYWFKVKNVHFSENEIRLKLEIVRALKNETTSSEDSEMEQNTEFDLNTTIHNMSNKIRTDLWQVYKEYVTFGNIKETVIFLSLLIGTIVVGAVNVIKYLMEYMLKFMKETSGLIKVMTPIIISTINLMGRTIHGLYSMIVVLFHGKPQPVPPVYNSYIQFDPNLMPIQFDPRQRYDRYFNQKALPYLRRSGSGYGPVITPMD